MKYVALDIGNVLCHVDFVNFLNDLSEALNITTDEASYFLNRSQKLHDLGLTVMADELRDHFKIKSQIVINKLLNSWDMCMTPDLEVLDMYNRLTQQHGLQVALLSNIGIEHTLLMEKALAHNGFFQNAVKHFSCEVGARKPSKLYYQSFLWEHPEFRGCVYVDDVLDNLATGEKFGFQPYHFDLSKMIIQDELPQIEKMILGS